VSPDLAADFGHLALKLDNDYEKANVKTMLRLVLKKLGVKMPGEEGTSV
jgi:hypothetical protein